MKFVLALSMLMSLSTSFAQSTRVEEYQVRYSDSADYDRSHSQFKLTDVRYFEVAKKVEITTTRHSCDYGDQYPNCETTRVLEREPVVQVNLEYVDGIFRDYDYNQGKVNVVFNFPLSVLSAEELATLKANSGLWDFSGRKHRARMAILKAKFELVVKKEKRTIQVVDTRRSRLCPNNDDYYPHPSPWCQEVIVYKDEVITVNAVKINVK